MLLKLENITKGYGIPQSDNYQLVLDNISLEVEEGESIAIIGPSGSGKTTLLNLIGSLDIPDKGRIFYKSGDITGLSKDETVKYRNKEIGFEVDDPITIEVEDAFSEEKKVFVMEKRLRVEYVYREES